MNIEDFQFEIFDRTDYIYRVKDSGSEKIKKNYSQAWEKWKKVVGLSLTHSKSNELVVNSTENWQNSGNLSSRFWSRIKNKSFLDKPSCIATMISKDNLRVYLEWHGYKNEHLYEERKIHNSWINFLDKWVNNYNINIADYCIWTNLDKDEDFKTYINLKDFMTKEVVKNKIIEVLIDGKNWVRIGKVFSKELVIKNNNVTPVIGGVIRELECLYNVAVGLSKPKIEHIDDKQAEKIPNIIKETERIYMLPIDLINHIHSYIQNKGFVYEKEEVMNLFLSLKTKPFVILSGISGTGKTKMVQWFAESIGCTEENGQFTMIPIRPDWNDGSDLLGYTDIKGDFKPGPLTKVIEEANEHPDLPHIVLLDEMNLARVEYYFSDLLSVMESRKWKEGKIISSKLLSEEMAEKDIYLPSNMYIVGTVNMDETTHPFSKKVLDRANTIEFNRVVLGNLTFLNKLVDVEPIAVGDVQLASKYLHLKDVYGTNVSIVEKVTSELVKINESLQTINAHVGYRVRDEICFYMAYNEEGQLMEFDQAFDHCVLQKILPRISGSDSRVERLLKELYQLFANLEFDEGINAETLKHEARYPNSAMKVAEMLRRLDEVGFTSFWIS
ncbi:AAA family ATPase [Cytobacillus spongiae]|uniref:HI_0552 family protein n=1 Tax=Cytobacillus spongiae TaxID=2901381 RepID=UPI001F321B5C|nr:HI_0552 family protein [Cytobacillus spongiae]UII57621.1 AAA family ATPase [Cytobacillus spongiae]